MKNFKSLMLALALLLAPAVANAQVSYSSYYFVQ